MFETLQQWDFKMPLQVAQVGDFKRGLDGLEGGGPSYRGIGVGDWSGVVGV